MQTQKQFISFLSAIMHYCPSGIAEDIFFVSLVRGLLPLFPELTVIEKDDILAHTLPSQKLPIYSGVLEGNLPPAGPFLFGTSTSENNTSAIYARGPVMTSSTRID